MSPKYHDQFRNQELYSSLGAHQNHQLKYLMILQLLNSICVQDLPLHYANCVVSLEYLNQRQSLEHSNFMDDLFLVCKLQFRRFLLQLKDLFKILHIHRLQNQLK